jgi:hypothetical protein
MKKYGLTGVSRFIVGTLVGGLIFSGSAFAYSNYAADNTPDGGYLLCANSKTKAVTFPNKLKCPQGSLALDLGSVQGALGPVGPAGPQGSPGKDASKSSGYLVTLKPQDVIASIAAKSDKTIISKTGFAPGFYNLIAEASMIFQSTNSQVALCSAKLSGNSFAYSGFPSHELANTWTGHTSQVIGVAYVASSSDSVGINCSFTGNTKINYGYMSLTPISAPIVSTSD